MKKRPVARRVDADIGVHRGEERRISACRSAFDVDLSLPTTTTMPHHCLSIQEILREICYHLNPYGKGSGYTESCNHPAQASLAALATTCKAFSDPALDVLWVTANLSHLLVSGMPDDFWHVNRDAGGPEYVYEPLRAIAPSDGERLGLYSSRIRHLRAEERTVNATTLSALGIDFRRIQRVSWFDPLDDFQRFHSTFLGPTFTSVNFLIYSEAQLSTLAGQHPQLKNVYAKLYNHSAAFSAFLGGLQSPETITVTVVTGEALAHLASRPNLRTLQLNTGSHPDRSFPDDLPQLATSIRAFPSLKELAFDASTQGVRQLLGWCTDVPLEDIAITIYSDDFPRVAELKELFGTLPAAISHGSLSTFDLDTVLHPRNLTEFDGFEDWVDCLIPSDFILALIHFSNLTTVRIRSAVGADFDDDDALKLARGCPLLKTVNLGAYDTFSGRPRATLRCLHHFARHCRSLAALTLTLDATVIPDPESDDDTTPPQTTLSFFNVQSSPISDSGSVARFLLSVFPKLRRLRTLKDFERIDMEKREEAYDRERERERREEIRSNGDEMSDDESDEESEDEDEDERQPDRIYHSLWKGVASLIPGCIMN
ncbi:hypothetical protein FB45DRAFT_1009058, partial [Roridomyces roridus]